MGPPKQILTAAESAWVRLLTQVIISYRNPESDIEQ